MHLSLDITSVRVVFCQDFQFNKQPKLSYFINANRVIFGF